MTKPGPKPGTPSYRPPRPIKERILSRVEVGEGECWNWTGPINAKGYGHTFIGSRVDGTRRWASIHRLAYQEWVGPIPDGLTIDHLCENKGCCNPDHLEPCSAADNSHRAATRSETCANGHSWTSENTYVRPSGRRDCRACKREAGRRAYAKHGPRQATYSERKCEWCGQAFRPSYNRNVFCSRSCAALNRHRRLPREL